MDANINLLLKNSAPGSKYIEPIMTNGFIPIITKATRIYGESFSLIDHVLTNSKPDCLGTAGTIISDISDHFINFTEILTPCTKIKRQIPFLKDNLPRKT